MSALCAAAAGLMAMALFAPPSIAVDDSSTVRVIVRSVSADGADVRVKAHGGKTTKRLDMIDAVAAEISTSEATRLATEPGVQVTSDSAVEFESTSTDTTVTPASNTFPASTGASALAAKGIDGRGITVAVLDTGISPVKDYAGRVVGGIDLSGEGNAYKDTFGHGTFIAGLVAGNGNISNGAYVGEAQGANLVSIKVAGSSGATSASTVIQGIDFAIRGKDRLGIKVLNLSLGVDPTESTTTSPLNAAVERAWAAGITVVVSAGNYGPGNGSISKPGDDPLVITVGATDEVQTVPTSDDVMTSFSSVGPTYADGWFKPDLVAPGRTVVSLRASGSTLDSTHPEGRVGSANFKGSGTSFSAAITSGAAALILQANPTATPDDVKGRILATAAKPPVGNPMTDGHGILDAATAATASGIVFSQSNVTRSGGQSPAVNGTVDLGQTWNGSSWNGSSWNGTSWTGSSWNGSSWNGSSWNGSSWNGSSWNGSSWNGSSWNGSSWNGSSWNGSSWNGSSWNGSSWNGSSWNGSSWNGSSWNGSSWNSLAWT